MLTRKHIVLKASIAALAWGGLAVAGDDEDLAKKTQNPVADLISLPLQLNRDRRMGVADKGEKLVLNVQPVIPMSINDEWNLISRTILPLVKQDDLQPLNAADASGVGDVTQSFFFSPKQPSAGGWIWGAGPVVLLPTASDKLLGSEKWGLGPTAVVLKQSGGWTAGALTNHIWSVAGDRDRNDISATFVQPFISYTTRTLTSFAINTESTYDWKTKQWSVPVNLTVAQMLKIGSQPISLTAGVRYWAQSPEGGAEGWGIRAGITFLFPK